MADEYRTVSCVVHQVRPNSIMVEVPSKPGWHAIYVAKNLQLLCPHCNVTKSGRDPIIHMQSLGRLL